MVSCNAARLMAVYKTWVYGSSNNCGFKCAKKWIRINVVNGIDDKIDTIAIVMMIKTC